MVSPEDLQFEKTEYGFFHRFLLSVLFWHVSLYFGPRCGCGSMVEHQLPKLRTGVRFPSPARYLQTYRHPIASLKGELL